MTDDRAFSVKSLADRWGCSTDAVYDMINRGEIRTFMIGKPDKKGKRKGLRIAAKEVDRCENGTESGSSTGIAPYSGGAGLPLPRSQMKALAGAKG